MSGYNHRVTRDEYLDLADKAYAACLAAQQAGDRDGALRMLDVADYYRGRALTAGKSLPRIKDTVMTDAHREAISKAKPGGPNIKAARKAGYKTRAELAAALGISPTFLSLILKGEKAMPEARALVFKKLTGKDWV